MSITYELACVPCREKVWVGQRDHLYTAASCRVDGRLPIERFLFEHQGDEHRLVFFSQHVSSVTSPNPHEEPLDVCDFYEADYCPSRDNE